MILADENIDKQLVEAIRLSGIDVQWIAHTHKGIADEEIIDLSKIPPRIILTEDKDFGEWVFAHGIKDISVIFLRYKYQDAQTMIRIVTDLITQKSNQLIGKFTVVTVNKIRMRDLRTQ